MIKFDFQLRLPESNNDLDKLVAIDMAFVKILHKQIPKGELQYLKIMDAHNFPHRYESLGQIEEFYRREKQLHLKYDGKSKNFFQRLFE